MASCCDPRGCDRTFGERFARRQAARYRRRGLDRTAQRIVDLVAARGVAGAAVLEVGGGVGDVQLELLKRGAARATNLELSGAYETHARLLLAEAGVSDRVERRLADIAAEPGEVAPADVVVLHRVVCCYPDYVTLLGNAADHARRLVVFSHPPRNALSRALIGVQNLFFRVRGNEFRVFAHPPEALLSVLAEHGFRPTTVHRTGPWRIVVAER